jgi:dolichol-phosphate mannosyltransferase
MGSPRLGTSSKPMKIAIIIPCYNVAETISSVLTSIGPEVYRIYCVDDASRDRTAAVVAEQALADYRIVLIRRGANGGVGAATVTGYVAALAHGADVLVKIDGDGQMDPSHIGRFVAPLLDGSADYVKGNRFFSIETVQAMPTIRIFGNAGLSLLTKLSTGYWNIFDPANGFTAIAGNVARTLPLEKLHRRYFFESDLLFRLGINRAKIVELPIVSFYQNENSHLSELRCLFTFPLLHARNFFKRIAYNYFLRNFSVASLNLLVGTLLTLFGLTFGLIQWNRSAELGIPATAGTVMLSALPFTLGIQFILSFLSHDVAMTPSEPLQTRLAGVTVLANNARPSITEGAQEPKLQTQVEHEY